MRFTNRDTYDVSNRYAYCDGNPISKVDPSGHDPAGDSDDSNISMYRALIFGAILCCVPFVIGGIVFLFRRVIASSKSKAPLAGTTGSPDYGATTPALAQTAPSTAPIPIPTAPSSVPPGEPATRYQLEREKPPIPSHRSADWEWEEKGYPEVTPESPGTLDYAPWVRPQSGPSVSPTPHQTSREQGISVAGSSLSLAGGMSNDKTAVGKPQKGVRPPLFVLIPGGGVSACRMVIPPHSPSSVKGKR